MDSEKIVFRRQVRPDDLENVREMVASTKFFYDFEIPVAVELVQAAVEEGDESGYFFLFAEVDGKTVAYSCYGQIACTDAGYDLYWIVTHNDYRGKGIGKILLEETHRVVKSMGGRYIIAETSGLPKYQPTRQFYISHHYDEDAVIKDFYMPGDDKFIYVKRL